MNKVVRVFAGLFLGLFLACSLTVGVKGQIEGSNETWTGSVTGYMNRSGVLHIVSSKGVTCEGEWVYTKGREGSGVLKASDGRIGRFDFVSNGRSGNGHGELGGQKFIFTFGGKVDPTPGDPAQPPTEE